MHDGNFRENSSSKSERGPASKTLETIRIIAYPADHFIMGTMKSDLKAFGGLDRNVWDKAFAGSPGKYRD